MVEVVDVHKELTQMNMDDDLRHGLGHNKLESEESDHERSSLRDPREDYDAGVTPG